MNESIRNALLLRLSQALEVNMDAAPVLTWNQEITIHALHKMAHKSPETLINLFDKLRAVHHCDFEIGRNWLKRICTQAGTRRALAWFDSRTGHMRDKARNANQRSIASYISYLCEFDEHSEIEEFLEYEFMCCDDCGEWESRNEMVEPYNSSNSICRSCIGSHYEYSDYYDAYVDTDNSRTAIDEDGSEVTIHCDDEDFEWSDDEDCYVHVGHRGRVIGGYHSSKGSFSPISSEWTKTNAVHLSTAINPSDMSFRVERFFGVELEVEARNDRVEHARQLNDALNNGTLGHRCFFENDGSLSNGFEIITQPMGLDMHQSFWEWVKQPNLLRGLTSHNTSTCGLHVHVTRRSLSKLQLSKMVAFVNHPDNRQLLETIARRYGSSYAKYSSVKRIGNALRSETDRYEALNIESSKTVEFRMFKGSLKYESIISAVQFANALVNFCSDQSGYGFKLDTKSFINFLSNPNIADDTKILRTYIDNKLESL